MNNIWRKLGIPFFALAPMDDVTDTVFRQVVASCARPDVFFTEFVSVDGLQSRGREAVLSKLKFTNKEKPLVAQVWGMKPKNYLKSAKELVELGFDGIDINMGCPVPKVVKLGACSALINNPELAVDIIKATQEGAQGKIPVSVKTRPGFSEVDKNWTKVLLEQNLDALTIHGRTSKQLSKVPNNWALVEHVREQRDEIAPSTVIIGNGDVLSRQQGLELASQHKLDGIMIGRGVFKDPYIFSKESKWVDQDKNTRLELFASHIKLFENTWQTGKNPATLKKFAKVYINGWEGASQLRTQLMTANSTDQLLDVLVVAKNHK